MAISLVILAAGMGSRYGGLKQLDGLGPSGQTIMDYSVHDAIAAGFDKVVFVIRRDFDEDFREKVLSKYNEQVRCEVVFQDMEAFVPNEFKDLVKRREKPWGTGHAILVVKNVVKEPFAAINADDFYGRGAFDTMAKELKSERDKGQYSMVGYRLANTLSDNGSVNRGICITDENGRLQKIFEGLKIERKSGRVYHHTDDMEQELDESCSVSMNFWGFQPDILEYLEADFKNFVEETKDDPRSEYFIPFVVNDMMKKSLAEVKVLPSNATWLGVTYQEDRERVVSALAAMSNKGEYELSF
ncbi:MAG: nucleotidyltransferase [Flavobacteriales bacterium]|nr:nucleotidyltransferase [Flavobacteriales bacterium]NNK80414.1 nucleotidyltransferase [Flavobacteriales bacterium]